MVKLYRGPVEQLPNRYSSIITLQLYSIHSILFQPSSLPAYQPTRFSAFQLSSLPYFQSSRLSAFHTLPVDTHITTSSKWSTSCLQLSAWPPSSPSLLPHPPPPNLLPTWPPGTTASPSSSESTTSSRIPRATTSPLRTPSRPPRRTMRPWLGLVRQGASQGAQIRVHLWSNTYPCLIEPSGGNLAKRNPSCNFRDEEDVASVRLSLNPHIVHCAARH